MGRPSVLQRKHGQACGLGNSLRTGGESTVPYIETDALNPVNIYGRSRAEAETQVFAAHPKPLVVRSSAFFGPWDSHNFVSTTLDALANGKPVHVADDIVVSPTYVPTW